MEQPSIDSKQVLGLFETAKIEGVSLDNATLEFAYRQTLERAAAKLAAETGMPRGKLYRRALAMRDAEE